MTNELKALLIDKSSFRDERETDTRVYSPLFGREIRVVIWHDYDRTDISDQQVETIESFSKIDRGLDKIKQELFSHWETVDNWGDFSYSTSDETFADAELSFLSVPPIQRYVGNVCLLHFRVKWDIEHGAEIFVRNGVIEEFANL